MGNCTISTRDTSIYYPSDWLVDGGPPLNTMGCPEANVTEDDEDLPLKLIYNKGTKYFGIVVNEHIVMESKDRQDIAGYVKDYVEKLQLWVSEQEELIAEAAANDGA